MKARTDATLIGVVVYDGVEPIDIGGTVGVISMAGRIVPGLRHVLIAETKGPVRLASGLTVLSDCRFDDAPDCDVYIVTGGPGWRRQVDSDAMRAFLAGKAAARLASVCTGALILAAAGGLDGKVATTRRHSVGLETQAPLDSLAASNRVRRTTEAAVVDDRGTITSGGVTLAIDGTLYILGRLYGDDVRDEIASAIEYDRAYAANRDGLGHVCEGCV